MPRATKPHRSQRSRPAGPSRGDGAAADGAALKAAPGDGKKWIGGASDDAWESVARRMLATRLHAVRSALTPAARRWEEDVEHVHRLRVATRRAAAALSVAADWLPGRKLRKIARGLKKVRRSAGEARDLDVLAARWSSDAKRAGPLESLGLIDELRSQRREAQKPLRRIDRRKWHRRFAKSIARLARRVRPPDGQPQTFGQQAVVQIGAEARAFFENALVDLADDASLHELRIRGKRLRYAMEIFAAALPPAFRDELYPQVEELQELLGRVNDHAEAVERLCLWSSLAEEDRHAHFGRLIDLEMADLEQAKRRFARCWSAARRDALRQGFAAALAPTRTAVAGSVAGGRVRPARPAT